MSKLSAVEVQRILWLRSQAKEKSVEAIAKRLGRSVAAIEQVLATHEQCATRTNDRPILRHYTKSAEWSLRKKKLTR